MNVVSLVGRPTKDPELKYTPNGIAVATFTLAVNRTFTNQQGEREADFINCIVWRKSAENVANYVKKGSLIGVNGRLQSRNYEDSEGRRVYVLELIADNVQFLEKKKSTNTHQPQSDNHVPPAPTQPTQMQNSGNHWSGTPIDISDDDLPF